MEVAASVSVALEMGLSKSVIAEMMVAPRSA